MTEIDYDQDRLRKYIGRWTQIKVINTSCLNIRQKLFPKDQNLGQIIQCSQKFSVTLKQSLISFLHEMSYNFCPSRSQRGDRPQLDKA